MEGQVCKNCLTFKSLSDFHKNKKCKNGVRPICKNCVNTARLQKYKNEEDFREKVKADAIKNRKKRIENNPNYRLKEKEKNNEARRKRRENKEYRQNEYKQNNAWKREKYTNDETYRKKIIKRNLLFQQSEVGKIASIKAKQKYKKSEKGKETSYKAGLKRRSKKYQVSFKPHERKAILERDNYICRMCGIKVHDRRKNWNTPDKAHIDHIVSLMDGGSSEPANLQILCRTCNLKKGAKSYGQLSLLL